jgi:hypothetical protein
MRHGRGEMRDDGLLRVGRAAAADAREASERRVGTVGRNDQPGGDPALAEHDRREVGAELEAGRGGGEQHRAGCERALGQGGRDRAVLSDVAEVRLAGANPDVDTPEDLARLGPVPAPDAAWFADMPRELRRTSGVGCIACHGPAAIPEPAARYLVLRAEAATTFSLLLVLCTPWAHVLKALRVLLGVAVRTATDVDVFSGMLPTLCSLAG